VRIYACSKLNKLCILQAQRAAASGCTTWSLNFKMNNLCHIFNDAASYVQHWLTRQPAVKEETLTDWLLFEVSEKTNRIRYRMYSRHEEARQTGADWEWWFVGSKTNLRLRVQAKKAQGLKDLYPELMRTNAYGLQIEKLISDSKRVNAIPMYAFFSSLNASGLCGGQGPKAEGVYLSSAHRIQKDFLSCGRKKIVASQVLAISNPISCSFCCHLSSGSDRPIHYFQHYFSEAYQLPENEDEKVGLHAKLPFYVESLLMSNEESTLTSSNDAESPQGFSSLMVVDLRDNQ
jgi:hypothetical protein